MFIVAMENTTDSIVLEYNSAWRKSATFIERTKKALKEERQTNDVLVKLSTVDVYWRFATLQSTERRLMLTFQL